AWVARSSRPATWQTASTKARARASSRRSLGMVKDHGGGSETIPFAPGGHRRVVRQPDQLNITCQGQEQQGGVGCGPLVNADNRDIFSRASCCAARVNLTYLCFARISSSGACEWQAFLYLSANDRSVKPLVATGGGSSRRWSSPGCRRSWSTPP